MALEWWEETFNDYGYRGKRLRCGHFSLDFCACWCTGDKRLLPSDPVHEGHTKDECTHDNCVKMECPACGNMKSPKKQYCEACVEEESL